MDGDLRDHIAALCAGDDRGHDRIVEAARSRPEALRPFHAAMIEADVVMWPWLPRWCAATEETAGRIVDLIDADHRSAARWLLALGSSRTRAAAEALRRWSVEPPPVADRLGTSISHFAREGGWELGADGGVRELTSPAGFELVPTEDAAPLAGSTPLGRCCQWCGLELLRRLDVDLDDPALADLGLTGHGRVVAVTCIHCGTYARHPGFFGEYRPDGTTSWSDHNIRPATLPPAGPHDYDEPTGRLALGGRRPNPVAGTAWRAGGSTLGGLPDWIQDADYPVCPSCGTTMSFLGMVTGEDLWGDDLGVGCDYIHFCAAGCGITSVVYQQS
jgi:hypothetical protein